MDLSRTTLLSPSIPTCNFVLRFVDEQETQSDVLGLLGSQIGNVLVGRHEVSPVGRELDGGCKLGDSPRIRLVSDDPGPILIDI